MYNSLIFILSKHIFFAKSNKATFGKIGLLFSFVRELVVWFAYGVSTVYSTDAGIMLEGSEEFPQGFLGEIINLECLI